MYFHLNFGIFAKLLNPIIIKKIAAKRMRNDPNCRAVNPINPFINIKELPKLRQEQPSKPISTALTP
jgi:hypothetical protein